MICAYIALGSNLQDPAGQLRRAASAIAALPGVTIRRLSSLYRSAAVGPGKQPDYLNAVAKLDTSLPPETLLDSLQRVELEQGRTRDLRWGPRTLDLDILLYGDQSIDTQRLSIPHPRLAQRNFVLYPLLEIADENLVLPDGTYLGTLVSHCPRGDLVQTDLEFSRECSHRDRE